MVKAWIAREKGAGGGWDEVDEAELTRRPVVVEVSHSALNYKDALALTGRAPIFRAFPMVPGIDLVGTVRSDGSGTFSPGDSVVATGWGMGETALGAYAQLASTEPGWPVKLPAGLSAQEAAAVGTAGLTAALAVLALEDRGLVPDKGPVLVTGPTGGVGGIAVALLARAGFKVVAATGRMAEADYLQRLGATDILDRAEFAGDPRPLGKERWAAAIDVAAGPVLAHVLSGIMYGGAVAATGLAQAAQFPANIAPFILRGVSLLGIDSVYAPTAARQRAWARIARDLDRDLLASMTVPHRFEEVDALAPALLEQKLRGRAVLAWG